MSTTTATAPVTTGTDAAARVVVCEECWGSGCVRSLSLSYEAVCDLDTCPVCGGEEVVPAPDELTLYRLTWAPGYEPKHSWDVTTAQVVAEASEVGARLVAAQHCGDECGCRQGQSAVPRWPTRCVWEVEDFVVCEVIGKAVRGMAPGLVLKSFNAG